MITKTLNTANIAYFKWKYSLLAQKARQLGLEVPTYKIISTRPQSDDSYNMLYELEISDINVVIDGWKVVSYIDATVPSYDSVEILPKSCYDKNPMLCEHCNKSMFRKYTYILKNIETGEYKQVGSTCIEDFVTTKSISKLIDYINSWSDILRPLKLDSEVEKKIRKTYSARDLLEIGYDIITKYDWVSTNKAMETGKKSSALILRETLDNKRYTISDETKTIVNEIIKYYTELNAVTEFDINMKNIALSEYITDTKGEFSLLLYSIKNYLIKTSNVGKNEYVGNINDIMLIKGTIISKNTYSTQFGDTILVTVNDNGNIIKSFVNPTTKNGKLIDEASIKDNITFTATVKKHEEYQGKKSTLVKSLKNVTFI